jgi:hypothetical protein
MIVELITQDLKAGTVAEVEKRCAAALEKRSRYSKLGGFWHTEIGPLNQVVHIWPYQDVAELMRVKAEVEKDDAWPNLSDLLIKSSADILLPFAFTPELKPANVGPYFEMRSYIFTPGELTILAESWELGLPDRLKAGPLCGVWHSALGPLNRFVQIWPFKTLNEREETREKLRAAKHWPPSVVMAKHGKRGALLETQENKILVAAAFSPIK